MAYGEKPVIFFDGQCGLCNRSVDWIIRHDEKHRYRFAPLQGETAAGQFEGLSERELLHSMWLKDEDGLHRESTALFRILRGLGGFWKLLGSVALALPKGLRDWAYQLVARNRYKLFPRKDSCRIPGPEERAYFLP